MSASWWAAKLAGDKPASTVTSRPAPQQFPYAQPASLPYVPPVTRKPESLSEALAMGVPSNGGDAARAGENLSCPMCGSANYFTNRTAMDEHGHRGSAGRCFDCGHTAHLPMQGAPPL